MFLLVGLGNPGPKYERNRHNVGFMAVDEIVRRHSFGPWKARFQSQVSEGQISGQKVLALKPMTFMNDSGRAVGEAARFFKLSSDAVWVIYDELDLAANKLKVKRGGGNAGHNGLRSIDAHLTKDVGKDYGRIRVGIGHPGDKSRVHGHVLGDYSKAEFPDTEKLLDAMADALPELVTRGGPEFMTKVALILKPPQKVTKDEATAPANSPARPAGKEAVDSALAQALAKAGLGKKPNE